MSCTLMWKPTVDGGNYVGGSGLRDILERKFGYPARISNNQIPYLEGLRDSGHETAQVLIDALYEKGEIEIYVEC